MLKYIKYNNKLIMTHTILFIILSFILSAITVKINEDYRLGFLIGFSVVVLIYFVYIIVGYLYLLIRYLKEIKKETSLIEKWKTDSVFRVFIANVFSAAYAFLYAIFSHFMIFFANSIFYLFIEEIYISIALIKIYLILNTNSFNEKKDKIDVCIIVHLVFSSILILSCSILIMGEEGTFYKYSFLVYAYAVYAFYALITAIYSFIRAAKINNKNNKIRKRYFLIKLSGAIFSMYVLMVSLLNQFSNDYKKALVYELIGGLVAGTLILIEGLIMIIQKYYINPKKQDNKTV